MCMEVVRTTYSRTRDLILHVNEVGPQAKATACEQQRQYVEGGGGSDGDGDVGSSAHMDTLTLVQP